MKILFVHPSNEMYGADKVLLEVIDAIMGEGKEIEVWLPIDVKYPSNLLGLALEKRGIKYSLVNQPVLRRAYFQASHFPKFLAQLYSSLSLLKRINPDLLYVNTTALAPLAFLGSVCGIETIVHVHEILDNNASKVITPMLRRVSRIIAVSDATKKALTKSQQKKTTVIYNGFDFEELEKLPEFPSGETVFLLASRWNSWKGHETFLRSWAKSNTKNRRLLIAGGPPLSGEKTDVLKIIEDLGIIDSIELVGELDDIRFLLARAHVVVVPSIRPDPLPTIAIEALASGRPVLASNIGGLPEIIKEGKTGWLVQAGNIEEWAKAIDEICYFDLSRMRSVAHEEFTTRFSSKRYKPVIYDFIFRNQK